MKLRKGHRGETPTGLSLPHGLGPMSGAQSRKETGKMVRRGLMKSRKEARITQALSQGQPRSHSHPGNAAVSVTSTLQPQQQTPEPA